MEWGRRDEADGVPDAPADTYIKQLQLANTAQDWTTNRGLSIIITGPLTGAHRGQLQRRVSARTEFRR